VRAYKFLTHDGRGVFSGHPWARTVGGPGAWVEAEVAACRSGIHACRPADLPYWLAPVLCEIELDGPVEQHAIKIVAPRGRLIRRVDGWNDETREAFSQVCIARARELAAGAPGRVSGWAPVPELAVAGPALMAFMAARIAEQLGGVEAYENERRRQSSWLVDTLGLV
jgi:hypothetical protein